MAAGSSGVGFLNQLRSACGCRRLPARGRVNACPFCHLLGAAGGRNVIAGSDIYN
jgi:hypothetical protein